MKYLLLFLLGSAVGTCGECNFVNLTGSTVTAYFEVIDGGSDPAASPGPQLITIPPGSSRFTHGGAAFWYAPTDVADLGDVYGTFGGWALSSDEDINFVIYAPTTWAGVTVRFKFSSPPVTPTYPTIWDPPTEWVTDTEIEVPVIGMVEIPWWIGSVAHEAFFLGVCTACGISLFRAALRWFKRADGTQGEV